MKYRKFRRHNFTAYKIICIVIIFLIAFLLTDAKLRPAIYDLAALEAYAEASRTINSAAERILTDNGLNYSDLVSISRTENGNITGITTDIVKMNLFKSQVTNAIDKTFSEKERAVITVPLGTATGITVLSGVGPDIKVEIGLSSSTYSDFQNIFQSAGINQTQHSLMLEISSTVILSLPNKRISKTVETSFCVAQTIIVGTVPDVMVE